MPKSQSIPPEQYRDFSFDLILINAIPSNIQKTTIAGMALWAKDEKGFDGINRSRKFRGGILYLEEL